jgi:hypothetical protein
VTRELARRFLWESRARFVAGYAKDIDWIHSMLVDLSFFTYLYRGSGHDAFRAAGKLYRDNRLARRLGFTVYKRGRARGEIVASLKQ